MARMINAVTANSGNGGEDTQHVAGEFLGSRAEEDERKEGRRAKDLLRPRMAGFRP